MHRLNRLAHHKPIFCKKYVSVFVWFTLLVAFSFWFKQRKDGWVVAWEHSGGRASDGDLHKRLVAIEGARQDMGAGDAGFERLFADSSLSIGPYLLANHSLAATPYSLWDFLS